MKYQELTDKIIRCAKNVHSILGKESQKIIYLQAMTIEFELRHLVFESGKEMLPAFAEEEIGTGKIDFFVEKKIMVEIKIIPALKDIDLAQALNSLESCQIEIGLLINFGSEIPEFKLVHNKKILYLPSQNDLMEGI